MKINTNFKSAQDNRRKSFQVIGQVLSSLTESSVLALEAMMLMMKGAQCGCRYEGDFFNCMILAFLS